MKSKIISIVFWLFFCSIFLISSQTKSYIARGHSVTSKFFLLKGNFQALRLSDPVNHIIEKAKSVIPKKKNIEISPRKWTITRCKARYALYPFELNKEKDWDFFIDLDRSIKNPPTNWKRLKISPKVNIYAKPGVEFLPEKPDHFIKKYPSLFIFLTFLWVTLFHVLMGALILSLLKISYQSIGIVWYLSTTYLAGFVCLSLAVWAYLLVGGAFEQIDIIILWGSILGLASFWSKHRFINDFRGMMNSRTWTPETQSTFIDKAFLVATIALMLIVILPTVLSPVWSWDAMSHWIMKSKVIFHQKALAFDYTGHNEYPILWPLNVAIYFMFSGGTYDELAKWASSLLFCSLIFQLIGGLKLLKLKYQQIWILIGIFLMCFLTHTMSTAYAENAFSAFFCATLVAIVAYFQQGKDNKYLILAAIMAIGLSTVKLEGAIASGMIALVFASLGSPPFSNRKYWFNALCIASTCLIAFLWIFWQHHVGFFNKSIHLKGGITLNSVQTILLELPRSLELVYGWKVFGFLGIFALSLVLGLKRKKPEVETFLLRITILLILFTIAAFAKWNAAEISRQIPTIARIFLHSLPAMILYIGCQIKN